MTIVRWLATGLLGLVMAGNVAASDFEAALSDETAQFTFRSDSSIIGWGGADLSVSYFYNENGDIGIIPGKVYRTSPPIPKANTSSPEVKAYVGSLDDSGEDVLAFGIGGEVRYTLPGIMPMSLFLHGHYSPDITSFGDIETIVDYRYGFQIEVLPQTTAFVSIRQFEIDTEDDGEVELDDDELQIGVRLTF